MLMVVAVVVLVVDIGESGRMSRYASIYLGIFVWKKGMIADVVVCEKSD